MSIGKFVSCGIVFAETRINAEVEIIKYIFINFKNFFKFIIMWLVSCAAAICQTVYNKEYTFIHLLYRTLSIDKLS